MFDEKEFINWLKIRGLGERTLVEYSKVLRMFGTDVTKENVMSFVQKHKNGGLIRAFINNLLEFVKEQDDCPEDIKNFKLPKKRGGKSKRILKWLTEEEIYKIAECMQSPRNKLMLLISFYGGLRISELIWDKINTYSVGIVPYNFKWNLWDKDRDEFGKLNIIGKRNKERQVYIPSWLMTNLNKWIEKENKSKDIDECNKNEPLFKLSQARWKEILYRASEKAIGYPINTHQLRASCAMWLLIEKKYTIEQIKDYLGHEKVDTTFKYIQALRSEMEDKFKAQ